MNRSVQRISLVLVAAALACSHKTPLETTPAPVRGPNADSIAAANAARQRASQARADSIARAQQMARDAAARIEQQRLAAAAAAAAAKSAMTAQIFFDYQKDDLLAASKATLDAKVPVMRAHPELRIRIEGNADDRGSDEYNLALGQRRSAAARRYLAERGIAESRIDVVSFGEERPVCRDAAENCWHQNRRDEFSIVAGGESLNSRQ